jgi:anti-anti-sigma factor
MFQSESQGAVEVITPHVPLNHEHVQELTDTIFESSFVGQPMVVLDMSRVPLLDSAGLETLLEVQQQLRESAGSLKLSALTPLCADALRATGLDERFEIYHDASEAVRSYVR